LQFAVTSQNTIKCKLGYFSFCADTEYNKETLASNGMATKKKT